ncbi:peptidase U49, Lit peptidase [Rhodobacter sp. ETT8]|uniref:Peptidase U49, Lit peptidase n=2 Tax=Pseudotabrizicola algicola TaxID=2709381 RepID=A0A6B3RWS1_9RHOB|nr:peptidase U49, Lit peptidase [Pseudotabrizicola algicola]
MTTEPSNRTIILNLLRGAVPERADEISSLWSQYGHAVEVAPSTKGVTMNADAKRIQFDTKTIDLFWLFGFNAWRAIEVYSPALVLATITGIPLDQALNADTKRGPFELDYKQRIASAQSLILADQTTEISWPADIPEPTSDRESLGDVQHMAAFDLVAFALAFSFLHEFQHVMYCADNSAPSALPEEEIACDTYARDFMTSGLAAYAKKHGHNFAEVQQKRAMGIALAAVIIHAMTPTHAHWGNRKYPPMAERLTAMISGYSLRAGSPFWLFTACLLIALMRQEHRPLDVIANSNQEMVEALLERLR